MWAGLLWGAGWATLDCDRRGAELGFLRGSGTSLLADEPPRRMPVHDWRWRWRVVGCQLMLLLLLEDELILASIEPREFILTHRLSLAAAAAEDQQVPATHSSIACEALPPPPPPPPTPCAVHGHRCAQQAHAAAVVLQRAAGRRLHLRDGRHCDLFRGMQVLCVFCACFSWLR